jgi:Rad3-related DNA helicase
MKILDKDLSPFELRKEQKDCLDFIFETISLKPHKKFFLLDLPTGVGKSILALKFIQNYLKDVDKESKFDILTESKMLQRQYTEEFNSISNLWGRNSYQCNQFEANCDQGKEYQKITKEKCENCPYEKDREQFFGGRVSLTNFHMFTLMKMNDLFSRRESNVLIVDEAHQLESVVSDFISVTLSETNLKKFDFKDQKDLIRRLKRIKTVEKFYQFLSNKLLNEVDDKLSELEKGIGKSNKVKAKRDIKIKEILGTENSDVSTMKQVKSLKSLQSKIINFLEEYSNDSDNWVIETDYDDRNKFKVKAQPIWAHPFFEKYIWKKYDKVVLMSGTILDRNMFSYLNGIPEEICEYYNIESPFLPKNRPIYYIPSGKMSYKSKQDTLNNIKPVLGKLLKKYKNKKGIIHTVSFDLQNWTIENFKTDRLLGHDSDQKSKNFAIKQHYTSNKPTILVSPSMGTGIDLKDNLARFQICLKVPYPSLADSKNKRRLKDKPEWYAWTTVSKFIQMYGRAVRNSNDYSHFIILDTCFSDVLNYSSKYIPDWIKNSIKRVDL